MRCRATEDPPEENLSLLTPGGTTAYDRTMVEAVRIAVVSDLHVTLDQTASAAWHNDFDFAGVGARIDVARSTFERAGVDAVIACGDITHAGDEPSACAALERLSDGLGRRVFVVAGNHDCLERDDQLERCASGDCEMLTTTELPGARLGGVPIERDREAGTFRWSGRGVFVGDDRVSVIASHFPVLSRAERLTELGLAYPGDLTNRHALCERLVGAGPALVLSGHIHARDSHVRDNVLQLSAGALVEAPYEAAIVDMRVGPREVRVRRRVQVFGPPATERSPVLAPADEAWTFRDGEWRPA